MRYNPYLPPASPWLGGAPTDPVSAQSSGSYGGRHHMQGDRKRKEDEAIQRRREKAAKSTGIRDPMNICQDLYLPQDQPSQELFSGYIVAYLTKLKKIALSPSH